MTTSHRARPRAFRTDAVAAARAAWQRADYAGSLALLDEVPPRAQRVEAAALRVRCLLRLRRNAAAVTATRALRDAARSPDELVTAAMLTAQALGRTNKLARAHVVADEARAAARKAHPAIRAELAYTRALLHWMAGNVDEADRIVHAALPAAVDGARTLLESLLGWIAVRRERFVDAARHFDNAIEADRVATHRDAHVVAANLLALAIVAAETLALPLADRVARALAELPPAAGTSLQRAKIHDLLGVAARLRGDTAAAWQHFDAARAAADEPAAALAATVELALLARHAGDRFTPERLLRDAAAAARTLDWHTLDADRRIALIDLATAVADVDVDSAAWALAVFDSIHPVGDGANAFDADRRPAAVRAVAVARIAQARGDARAAIDAYRDALAVFTAIDYRRRACEIDLQLYRLTGAPQYLRDAERLAGLVPQSYLAHDVERSRLAAGHGSLSATERRVLAALLAGKSANAIAIEFGRSVNTINNHTKRIFKAMGVRSRPALMAECVQLGLVAQR